MSSGPSIAEPRLSVYQLSSGDSGHHATAPDDSGRAAMLRQNAEWFCRLRWIVVLLLLGAAAAGLAPDALAWTGVRLGWTWALAAALALAAANVAYRRILLRLPETAHAASALIWTQIVVDLVVLSAVVHFLGSLTTYAPFAYLFHVVLACVFFPPRASLAVTALAGALFLGSVQLETGGAVSATSVVQAFSAIAIWLVIWYLVSRLASRLRQREAELAATNRRLRASSEERMRHMVETTHQLKAPFAAIHAQAQLLLEDSCGPLGEGARRVVEKIALRSKMLSQQIQDMLQLANLRSTSQRPAPSRDIDLSRMAQALVERLAPSAALRGVRIQSELTPVTVCGVDDHLWMVLENLLANAVNYSRDGGQVELRVSAVPTGAQVVVQDHGIGIPENKLASIFDDFYRTKEAVRHNPSSTGLGLAIVRDVVRMDGLELEVTSGSGWGTRFTLSIPYQHPCPLPIHEQGVSHGVPADR